MKLLFPVLLLFLLISIEIIAGFRPMALKPTKECELWVGTANGNDPSVQVELSLCSSKDEEITGVLQWSSEISGWSKRAIRGIKNSAKSKIILHDAFFLENKPNKGWRFCLIDEYNLSYSKDTLVGSYYSKSCKDQARLSFVVKR